MLSTCLLLHPSLFFFLIAAQADEKARKDMYKLRQTWKMVFPADILRALDVKTKEIDPNWPILKASSSSGKKPVATSKSTPAATANPAPATGPGVSKQLEAVPTASPAPITAPNSIHFNPKFFATVRICVWLFFSLFVYSFSPAC